MIKSIRRRWQIHRHNRVARFLSLMLSYRLIKSLSSSLPLYSYDLPYKYYLYKRIKMVFLFYLLILKLFNNYARSFSFIHFKRVCDNKISRFLNRIIYNILFWKLNNNKTKRINIFIRALFISFFFLSLSGNVFFKRKATSIPTILHPNRSNYNNGRIDDIWTRSER